MKCGRCISRGDEAPDMKVFENSDSVYMKCPKCGWSKGVKKPKK